MAKIDAKANLYISQPCVNGLCNISTARVHIWFSHDSGPASLMIELFLLFNRGSRQGGRSARGILFYDPVSMIETSDLAPALEDLLSEIQTLKTEGNSFYRPSSAIGQRQVGHMCSWLMSLPMWALFVCPHCGNMSASVRQE